MDESHDAPMSVPPTSPTCIAPGGRGRSWQSGREWLQSQTELRAQLRSCYIARASSRRLVPYRPISVRTGSAPKVPTAVVAAQPRLSALTSPSTRGAGVLMLLSDSLFKCWHLPMTIQNDSCSPSLRTTIPVPACFGAFGEINGAQAQRLMPSTWPSSSVGTRNVSLLARSTRY